jgi:hypothetical protein
MQYIDQHKLRQLISVHPNDRLINEIFASLNGIRARAHLPLRHSAETELGADQLRAAPPASTHNSLTDAQTHAIIVNREINHSKIE